MEYVNGKPFSDFGAIFVSFVYAFPTIEADILRLGMSHIDLGYEVLTKEKILNVVFEDEIDISSFLLELLKGSTIDIDDGFIYDCKLLTSESTHLGCNKYDVRFTLSTIKKKPLVTIDGNAAKIEGNYKAEAIYEITAKSDVTDVTVDGMKIKSITSGDTFVINGIDKLVYRKSNKEMSAFDDTDITSFPQFDPGTYTLFCNSDQITVVIKYYPTYL